MPGYKIIWSFKVGDMRSRPTPIYLLICFFLSFIICPKAEGQSKDEMKKYLEQLNKSHKRLRQLQNSRMRNARPVNSKNPKAVYRTKNGEYKEIKLPTHRDVNDLIRRLHYQKYHSVKPYPGQKRRPTQSRRGKRRSDHTRNSWTNGRLSIAVPRSPANKSRSRTKQPTAIPKSKQPKAENKSGKPVYTFRGKKITEKQFDAIVLTNQAAENIADTKWKEAETKVNKAISLYPDFFLCHALKAYLLARQSKFSQAEKEIKLARSLAPDDPQPLYLHSYICQGSGKIKEAIPVLELLISKFPKHEKYAMAKAFLESLKLERDRQLKVTQNLRAGDSLDNYLAYVTMRGPLKWKREKFPLKVYVPSDKIASETANYKPEYQSILKESFAEWEKNSEGQVAFQFVDSPEKSNIECLWVDTVEKLAKPTECGETRSAINRKEGIIHAKILLLTRRSDLPPFSDKEIRHTCLHEIGHSLGLLGHSPEATDNMYFALPITYNVGRLTNRDTTTLKKLYQRKLKISHKPQLANLPNNSIALNEDGIQMMESDNLDEAVEQFEKALKINPELQSAKQNLSACLQKIASKEAKKGRLEKAAETMKKATEINTILDKRERKRRISNLKILSGWYKELEKPDEASKTEQNWKKLSMVADAKLADDVSIKYSFITPKANPDVERTPFNLAVKLDVSKEEKAAQKEVNFGPFMAALQKKIKAEWHPPQGNRTRRGIVQFKIKKNGHMHSLKLKHSTGTPESDDSMLTAVKKAAPFDQLPDGSPSEVDIQFTFDYNVFMSKGGSRYRRISYTKPEEIITSINSFEDRIKRLWYPPKKYRSRTVTVNFRILKSGKLANLKVSRSSGVSALDNSALSALRKLGSMKALPEDGPDYVEAAYLFNYSKLHSPKKKQDWKKL